MKYVLIFLSVISFSAMGQDYLITIQGDTLHGKIKPQGSDRIERVKLVTAKETKNLSAMQVKEYSFRNKIYRPIQYENAIRFMQVLKSGYLSLLAFHQEGQNTMEGRLLMKLDGTKLEVPNLTFRRMISNFLSECESVQKQVEDGNYGRKDLDKIIDEFNVCIVDKTKSLKLTAARDAESIIKIAPLDNLETQVKSLADFATRKDALDLIHDLQDKIKSGKTIPNYQFDALKGMLGDKTEVKDLLEKVLTSLKVN